MGLNMIAQPISIYTFNHADLMEIEAISSRSSFEMILRAFNQFLIRLNHKKFQLKMSYLG